MTWAIIKVVWLVIAHLLAAVGAFAIFGGIRVNRRKRGTTKLERDIEKWERIKKQYQSNSNAEKN